MPYFVFRVDAIGLIRKLTPMGAFTGYREASEHCRNLRQSEEGTSAKFRLIFGDNELHAADLLSEVRVPEPNVGDDY